MGRCARTAASFWVFLTRSATDFFAGTAFFGAAFRATTFFTAVRLGVDFRAAAFDGVLPFATTLALLVFFVADLRATARVALGRLDGLEGRRFAADFVAAL